MSGLVVFGLGAQYLSVDQIRQLRDSRGDRAIRGIELGAMDRFLVICSSELHSQVLERRRGDIRRGLRRGLAKGGEEAIGFSLTIEVSRHIGPLPIVLVNSVLLSLVSVCLAFLVFSRGVFPGLLALLG